MSDYSGSGGSVYSLNSNDVRLAAKPHAFAGAVLSPKHARELTPTLCMAIATALADQNPQQRSSISVPYTLWITEAWRVLGWAEPSAALFWELATMYNTLMAAGRMLAENPVIPPILSCGSANSSLASGATSTVTDRPSIDKKKFDSVASAKELPVALIGTFLLLHCEEFAYQRNLSGHDDRRFYGRLADSAAGGKIDFTTFFKHSALSPRTLLHAGWNNDNTHCTAYILRHLRKILLLSAIPHNREATHSCLHLAAIPPPTVDPQRQRHTLSAPTRLRVNMTSKQYDANDLRRQHDDEHGNVGLSVRLTMEDLDRLDLILQAPRGGRIDHAPLKMGEFLWKCLYNDPPPPTASIPLGDVEREIRQFLELELLISGYDRDDEEQVGTGEKEEVRLSTRDKESGNERAKQASSRNKELSYSRLRGTTILLKPNPSESSPGASIASGEPNFIGNVQTGRLHDLVVSDCSDAHFYLLQPFEYATIAACSGCTIVVGAVAGLLHIVDCEKTTITAASRRILVSNCSDVKLYVFTPSPPLLVGDNRSCQFAPYNTYYDGLREDLLATGLAAAVVSDNHTAYAAGRGDNDAAWPPLQCASNKWKQPVDVAKLEVPEGPGSASGSPPNPNTPLAPGADDRAMMGNSVTDTHVALPVLLPAADFQVLFVPWETESSRQRRIDAEEGENGNAEEISDSPLESQYCRLLAEVLQLSPFRLPQEYERRALMKAERMKNIQQAFQRQLTPEQQHQFEEELNRGFRDWLVTSGNLRQVLDLVHLDVKGES